MRLILKQTSYAQVAVALDMMRRAGITDPRGCTDGEDGSVVVDEADVPCAFDVLALLGISERIG